MGKITPKKICKSCGKEFPIFDEEKEFLKRIGVPEPIDCSTCREQRRITFRNERSLYLRECESCKKQTVSIYSPDKPYHVYCQACWWSDKWDPVNTGREYDFNRTFSEQFDELLHASKLVALFGKNNQNSEYVNQETDDKNCYMNVGGHYNEDCFYNTYSIWGKNNVDNYWVIKSELLYECIKCENCFNSTYLQECENCSDCNFCRDMKGCNNCFGCFSLRHKEYYFFNEHLGKEKYEEKIMEMKKEKDFVKSAFESAQKHFLNYPHKALEMINCENSIGDDTLDCKNVKEGFLTQRMEDGSHAYIALDIKDSHDISSIGWGEMMYNSASSGELNYTISVSSTWNSNNVFYCFVCHNSSDLFGCVGLNQKQYCILNKQYSKEEYEELLPQIIEHMKKMGEYGQFFDPKVSPFCYNETVAMQFYPLTKEEVLAKGYKWKDEDKKEYSAAHDDILACAKCGKNYKIVPAEAKFYEKMKLFSPDFCPNCRHLKRLSLRNPRQLWNRKCDNCNIEIKSTYSPEKPEIIYCEKCYLAKTY